MKLPLSNNYIYLFGQYFLLHYLLFFLFFRSAIFASNTSSLPIRDISSLCSEQRLANFGGLHFFNPVPVMKLVEIVRIPQTSDETYQNLKGFTDKLGKVSVETKDTPGFIVNRLLVPYMASAVKMLERGNNIFIFISSR